MTKVLIAHPFGGKETLARIQAVDPRVEVVFAPYVDDWYRQRFTGEDRMPYDGGVPPQDFHKHIGDAEAVFTLHLPDNVRGVAPRLKWVQFYGGGIHHIANSGVLESGIKLTLAPVISNTAIAEFCLLLMLTHAKNFVKFIEAQQARQWGVKFSPVNTELEGKTLGIIGPGRIGAQIAKRAAGFEMRILAARGNYRPGEKLPHIQEVYPAAALRDMLAQCDYVALSVGLRAETRKMIGEAEIRAMKAGAYFINISRGAMVDQAALIRALQDGHLGGAGLDVFEQEPLPVESPLWAMPNVVVLPHSTGGSREGPARATEVFCRNLKHYLNGEPMENVAPPERGYFEGYQGSPTDQN